MADPITGKPILSPLSLAVSFKNHTDLAMKWKNPAGAKSGHQRYTDNYVEWEAERVRVTVGDDGTLKKGAKFTGVVSGGSVSPQSVVESASATLNRNTYYPVSSSTIVERIRVTVYGRNSYGKIGSTRWVALNTPRKPSITASFNASNGRVTFTVKTNAGTDTSERYDTIYWVERQDEATVGAGYGGGSPVKVVVNTASTSTSIAATHDVQQHATLTGKQWVKLTCKAYARGMAGNSAVVSKTYLLAAPGLAAITRITAAAEVNGRVNIFIKPNATANNPIGTLKLQRLTNTTIGTAAAAASASGWEDVDGAVDNGECAGFTDQKSAATPEVRKHTWYRVVSTYGAISAEGMPIEAKCLYRDRDAASADAIKWPLITSPQDGEGIELKMGWATDNYTATEVSWDTNRDAWESNKQPQSFVIDWEDANPVTYAHTARFIIRDVEAGVPVYIRARRVKVEDNNITLKGEWCSPPAASYPITPGEIASDVMLFAPSYITRGSGIDVTWTFNGPTVKRWALYKVTGTALTTLVSGSTSTGKCTVAASKLAGLSSVTLRLGIEAGGTTSFSSDAVVAIYTQPTLTASVPATLTAKPLTATFTTNDNSAAVQVRLVAEREIDPGLPDESGRQLEGDVVWAGRLMPSWSSSNSAYTGTLEIDADLIDGGAYRVEALAIDAESGLSSDMVEAVTEVDWSHKAAAPEVSIVVDGEALAVEITPAAPEDAEETDVCDVYRLSGGRAWLITQDVAFGDTVVDNHAPYSTRGGLAYRLATRTVDGDVDWVDAPYNLESDAMTIEFGNDSLRLPWGVARVPSYAKPFSVTPRWDGSMPGQWDGGVTHQEQLSTHVIQPDGPEQVELLDRLGRYMGACFVRTPDGAAYAANVDVESYGGSMNTKAHPVSLRATEIDLTDEFRAEAE